MHKILVATALGLAVLTAPVQAGDNQIYRYPGVSVAQALYMEDDRNIRLTGYVVEQIDDEKYLFQNGTGTLMVEIDDDEWRGIQASSRTRLTIWGELDQDDDGPELEVDHLELAY